MTSTRQIDANRNNAKRSTGPKTEAGKARASRNALRHGLSRLAISDGPELAVLAGALVTGLDDTASSLEVRDIARAKLALAQIRAARSGLLTELLEGQIAAQLKRLAGMERYERAAMARQKRALRALRLGSF